MIRGRLSTRFRARLARAFLHGRSSGFGVPPPPFFTWGDAVATWGDAVATWAGGVFTGGGAAAWGDTGTSWGDAGASWG